MNYPRLFVALAFALLASTAHAQTSSNNLDKIPPQPQTTVDLGIIKTVGAGATCDDVTLKCDAANGYSCVNSTCTLTDPTANLKTTISNAGQAPAASTPSTPTPAAATNDTNFVPLAPIPGLTQGATASQAGLVTFLQNLYKYLIGLAAVLAVIYITWGGIEMSVSEAIPEKLDGKKRIYDALFGLVLVLAPAIVFGAINPSILDLSANIPSLNTTWANWSPQTTSDKLSQQIATGGGTGGATTVPTAIDGCTTTKNSETGVSVSVCNATTYTDSDTKAQAYITQYCADSNSQKYHTMEYHAQCESGITGVCSRAVCSPIETINVLWTSAAGETFYHNPLFYGNYQYWAANCQGNNYVLRAIKPAYSTSDLVISTESPSSITLSSYAVNGVTDCSVETDATAKDAFQKNQARGATSKCLQMLAYCTLAPSS